MDSLSHYTQINKGFSDWRLPLYFSKPILRILLMGCRALDSQASSHKFMLTAIIRSIGRHSHTFFRKALGKIRIYCNNPSSLFTVKWRKINHCFTSWMTQFQRKQSLRHKQSIQLRDVAFIFRIQKVKVSGDIEYISFILYRKIYIQKYLL